MAIARYAGVGATCPLFNITISSSGNLTAGSLYFSFQLRNRAGYNVPSTSSIISFNSGQKISINIADSVRKQGWDIRYYVISAGTSANPATHVQIAQIPNYEYGEEVEPQATQITLPYTLELSRPAHISLAGTVTSLVSLPTGADRLPGQVRWVTSEAKWFEYRPDSTLDLGVDVFAVDVGQWVRVNSPSTYVSLSTGSTGSDKPLPTVDPASGITINPPDYPGNAILSPDDPDSPSLNKVFPEWDAKYWIYNDDNSVIPEGLEFGIQIEYEGINSPDLADGKFFVEFLGYVQSNGTIRTTRNADSTQFTNIGGYFPWTPRSTTIFLLPDDVQPGEAIALSVKPFFSSVEFNNQVSLGSIFSIAPVFRTQSGDFNALGKLFREEDKGTVYNLGDRYRVVPDVELSYKVLSGSCIVANYDFPKKPTRTFGGLVANTANQWVIVNGNGGVFTELNTYTIQSSEALRAIVGTIAGESTPGTWGSYTAITSTQAAVLTLTYPCSTSGLGTVRANYPDVIAENNKGVFNPYTVTIYLQRQDTLEIRKFTNFLVVAGTSQQITINTWTDGTIVSSLPTAPSDFSLFAPGASAIASGDAGDFPVTNYRACYSFIYDGNQVTSISHDSPPCLYEWEGDFQPPSITVDPVVDVLAPGEDGQVVNSGSGNAAILKFSIPSGSNAYTTTTADFVQPAVDSNVTVSVLDSAWVASGQNLFIESAGNYQVVSKPDEESLILKNLGYTGNVSPASNIVSNKTVAASGAIGTSLAAYTTTTAIYVQPSVNSNVTVSVVSSDWMTVGQSVFVESGGNYEVVSKPDSISVYLKNLGYSGNASPTSTIATTKAVSPSGIKGDTGATGATGSQGIQGNAATITVGTVTTGTAGSSASITNAGTTSAAILNFTIPRGATGATGDTGATGATGATGTAATVAVGTVTTGAAGSSAAVSNSGTSSAAILDFTIPQGAAGSVSATSNIAFTTQSSNPTTASGVCSLYFLTTGNVPTYREPSNGTVQTLAILGKAQQYTATQGVNTVNLTDAATVALDMSLSNKYKVILGGNRTLAISNMKDCTFTLRIKQDATGSRTLTYPSSFKFPGGTVPTLTTAANASDLLSCECDGTDCFCVLSKDLK